MAENDVDAANDCLDGKGNREGHDLAKFDAIIKKTGNVSRCAPVNGITPRRVLTKPNFWTSRHPKASGHEKGIAVPKTFSIAIMKKAAHIIPAAR